MPDLMLKKYLELRNSEEGQTLAEYALLLALIAIVVIAALLFWGQRSVDLLVHHHRIDTLNKRGMIRK